MLEKDKIIIFFHTKNKEAPYFEKNTIELPFDDEFLFTVRLKQLYNTRIQYEDYNITGQLFFSDLYPTETKSNGQDFYLREVDYYKRMIKNYDTKSNIQDFYLREVFLDFLFEFFYQDTFKSLPYYKDIKKNLLKIPIALYIYAKAQFYYYKDAEIYGTDLYREILDRWSNLLLDSKAEKILHSGGGWFEPLNEEINELAKEIFEQRQKEILKSKNKKSKEKNKFLQRIKSFLKKIFKRKKQTQKNNNQQNGKKEKQTQINNLQESVLEWQISNFQLEEIFAIYKDKTILNKIIVLLLLAFGFGLSTFIFSNCFLFLTISTLVLFIGIAVDLAGQYGFRSLFKILSFEFFIVSSAIWFSWASSDDGVIFPYSVGGWGYFIVIFIALLVGFAMLKGRIKYISSYNTLLLLIISLTVSFGIGSLTLNINKDTILSRQNQISILESQDKISYVKNDSIDIKTYTIYVFKNSNSDSVKIKDKIYHLTKEKIEKISLATDSLIPKNTYLLFKNDSLIMLNADRLLYDYAKYTDSPLLTTQKIGKLNVIFMPRYLLFWTVISTVLGSFVYLWINSRVRAQL